MMIDEVFQQYVADVVERYFRDAPAPDGKIETNRRYLDLKESACKEIGVYIASHVTDEETAHEMHQYADRRSHSAIYAVFPKIKRKPKRYKYK